MLHVWNLYSVNVGKYPSTIEHMGLFQIRKTNCLINFHVVLQPLGTLPSVLYRPFLQLAAFPAFRTTLRVTRPGKEGGQEHRVQARARGVGALGR